MIHRLWKDIPASLEAYSDDASVDASYSCSARGWGRWVAVRHRYPEALNALEQLGLSALLTYRVGKWTRNIRWVTPQALAEAAKRLAELVRAGDSRVATIVASFQSDTVDERSAAEHLREDLERIAELADDAETAGFKRMTIHVRYRDTPIPILTQVCFVGEVVVDCLCALAMFPRFAAVLFATVTLGSSVLLFGLDQTLRGIAVIAVLGVALWVGTRSVPGSTLLGYVIFGAVLWYLGGPWLLLGILGTAVAAMAISVVVGLRHGEFRIVPDGVARYEARKRRARAKEKRRRRPQASQNNGDA